MRKRKLITLIGSIGLVLVFAALPFMTACPAPVPPEEVIPPPVTPPPGPKAYGEELTYVDVMCPRGQAIVTENPSAPRLDTLDGKTIAQIWGGSAPEYSHYAAGKIRELLEARFTGMKFIEYRFEGYSAFTEEAKKIADECDAAIITTGT